MDLSSIYVKFGFAGRESTTQPSTFGMIFDPGKDQPVCDLELHLELEKRLDAPLSALTEQAKNAALELLREAVRLLEQCSVAELDEQVADRRMQEADAWERQLGGDPEPS